VDANDRRALLAGRALYDQTIFRVNTTARSIWSVGS
jgi:hypothetical protein